MSLVLDASITLARLFPNERTPAIQTLFVQVAAQGAIVTDLWPMEVANCLVMAVQTKRITEQYMNESFNALDVLPIVRDVETNLRVWSETVKLAMKHRLTVYDATYLELALRLGLPLATLDRQLRTASKAEGIPLLGL